ncbi:MAG: ComF family protein [Gemmatimonadales bacterium]
MPRFAEAARALTGVERWLLPPACLLCDGAVPVGEGDVLVCGLCRSRWRPVVGPQCDRCGQPAFGDLECRICQSWTPGLTRVRSAVWLAGGAREAVHHLKYQGWSRVADSLAEAMRGLEPLTGQVCLIPIPLGSRRLRERGYNQSERIARGLGALTGLPVRTGALARVRETPTQTALTPEGRRANMAGAFNATGVEELDCILVDDVFTTGATLAEAGSALAAGGAARVEAVTFARAVEMVG